MNNYAAIAFIFSLGVGLAYSVSSVADGGLCSGCGLKNKSFYAEFKGIFNKLNEDKQCIELKPGEKRNVNIYHTDSPTGLGHDYELTRDSDKDYTLNFNLVFNHIRGSFVKSEAEAQAVIDEINAYHDYMDKCLTELNPYMKGPAGEALKLKVSRHPAKRSLASAVSSSGERGFEIKTQFEENLVVPITLHSANSNRRATSLEHVADMNCATVVHELLHLAGLCDEYRETSIGYVRDPQSGEVRQVLSGSKDVTAYNCRILGPDDSIMNNHNAAVASVRGVSRLTGQKCFAAKKTKAQCQQLFKQWDGEANNCPAGMRPTIYSNERDPDGLSEFDTLDFSSESGECWLNRMTRKNVKKRDSLLMPAHFFALTRPGCQKYNSNYYTCAKRAYQTDMGKDAPEERVCDKGSRPEGCEDGEGWLNSVTGVK